MSTSLAAALNAKYSSDPEPPDVSGSGDGDEHEFVIFAPKAGFHKCVPNTLIITSSGVNEAGDSETLQKFLGNATELDVSGNKLADLNEIAVILRNAPKLKIVNLGFNDLSNTTIPQSLNFPIIESLHTLILVGTNAKWSVVLHMLRQAKNVEDLHLSLNKYKEVLLDDGGNVTEKVTNCTDEDDSCSTAFGNVKTVMFDDNPVETWEEISKLGFLFPNLRLLSLTSCPITRIPEDAHVNFKSLKTLWMSNSLIAELEDLENLKHFPSLADLRTNGMPYLKDFKEEQRRQHIIALLPNIETLNRGRVISADDKETAERNFIRYYKNHADPPARFQELKSKHGEVQDLVNVKLGPPKKLNVLIRHEEKEVARMALDPKMTTKELKELLEPLVGIQASKMYLYYYDVIGQNQDVMKYPSKRLYTYHMEENDEIIIKNVFVPLTFADTMFPPR